jgi:peptide/nickel transport system substrate-binding protein
LYYIGWNNERPPLDDPVVRRALALAIDRQTIIEALLYGQGSVATSPIPPWSPVHPSSVQPLERDSAEAVRLLERAGWSDRDGDGVRENADGQPLRFTSLASNDQLRRSVVEVVQSHLAAVGVTADIRIAEFQTMIAAHRGRDFDAIFTNWILDNFQVAAAPFALFHSTEADKPGSANRSTVRDAMLDSLIDGVIRSTFVDEQQSIWRDVTLRLQETQPLTFMFWLNELAAYNGALSGVTMDPRGELLTIARWSLRQ